jgi:hypothetical protein
MGRMNKVLIVGALGLFLTLGGGLLRLNAKPLATQAIGSQVLPDRNGQPSDMKVTWKKEDPAVTSALAAIGIALLITGGALVVVAAGAWIWAAREQPHSAPTPGQIGSAR